MAVLERPVRDAAGLVTLALARIDQADQPGLHPGVQAHLRAARTQLDAACTLLELHPTPPANTGAA